MLELTVRVESGSTPEEFPVSIEAGKKCQRLRVSPRNPSRPVRCVSEIPAAYIDVAVRAHVHSKRSPGRHDPRGRLKALRRHAACGQHREQNRLD